MTSFRCIFVSVISLTTQINVYYYSPILPKYFPAFRLEAACSGLLYKFVARNKVIFRSWCILGAFFFLYLSCVKERNLIKLFHSHVQNECAVVIFYPCIVNGFPEMGMNYAECCLLNNWPSVAYSKFKKQLWSRTLYGLTLIFRIFCFVLFFQDETFSM